MSLLSIKHLCVAIFQPLPVQGWRRFVGLFWLNRGRTQRILDQVSLDVASGDFLVILGANGSGKTTLLRTIAGLVSLQVHSGEIVYQGHDISRLQPHLRDIALVSQHGGWYDHLTVKQNLSTSRASQEDVSNVTRRLGLAAVLENYPNELSGGQAQRLALARALLKNAPLILLDEPFNHLDPSNHETLRQLLEALHREGKTLIMVTHDQFEAMRMATKLAILNNGIIQQIGTPSELYHNPNHRSVALALGEPMMHFFQLVLAEELWQRLVASSYRDLGQVLQSVTAQFPSCLRSTTDSSSSNQRVYVGIRPESIQIVASNETAQANSIAFEAVLQEQRSLGALTLTTWKTFSQNNSHTLTIQAAAIASSPAIKLGETRTLRIALNHIHLFDSNTDNRLDAIKTR